MKNYAITATMLSSLMLSSVSIGMNSSDIQSQTDSPNVKTKLISNIDTKPILQEHQASYPTYVVRFKVDLSPFRVTCTDIFEMVERDVLDKLYSPDASNLSLQSCTKQPESGLAEELTMSALFYATAEDGERFLETFNKRHPNLQFLSTTVELEKASGLVLLFDVSSSKNGRELYSETSKFYFDSYTQIHDTFFDDIDNNFFSNQPDLIESFIKKWGGDSSSLSRYLNILPLSNHVKVTSKLVFILDKQPRAYEPIFKFINQLDCTIFPSKMCL